MYPVPKNHTTNACRRYGAVLDMDVNGQLHAWTSLLLGIKFHSLPSVLRSRMSGIHTPFTLSWHDAWSEEQLHPLYSKVKNLPPLFSHLMLVSFSVK
jgi:hypothetical protein